MISLLLLVAAILGFIGGSIWLFSAAIGFLILKMFPLLLVVLVLAGIGLLVFRYYWRQ